MRQILPALLMVALCLGISYAQVPGSNKKAVINTYNDKQATPAQAANELCECINNYLNSFHPVIKQFIMDIAEKGEEAAIDALEQKTLTLSEREKKRVMTDIEHLQDGEHSNQMLECFTNIEQKYSDLNDATFGDKLMAELQRSKNCKFLLSLMKTDEEDDR